MNQVEEDRRPIVSIVFAQAEQSTMQALLSHLSLLRRPPYDAKVRLATMNAYDTIGISESWPESERRHRLGIQDIALVLLSQDLLLSPYYYAYLEQPSPHERVVPIRIRRCDLANAYIQKLPSAPVQSNDEWLFDKGVNEDIFLFKVTREVRCLIDPLVANAQGGH